LAPAVRIASGTPDLLTKVTVRSTPSSPRRDRSR
jgi:hypothetical protein